MTKAQVQIVIDNFRKVLPLTVQENHLEMMESEVNGKGHVCGSVHCHGGWYAVAVFDHTRPLGFLHGADRMAEDLGFGHNNDLEDWAQDNPYIWGNSRGSAMFISEEAFKSESRPEGAQNLQDIIDHWVEVQSRLTE